MLLRGRWRDFIGMLVSVSETLSEYNQSGEHEHEHEHGEEPEPSDADDGLDRPFLTCVGPIPRPR